MQITNVNQQTFEGYLWKNDLVGARRFWDFKVTQNYPVQPLVLMDKGNASLHMKVFGGIWSKNNVKWERRVVKDMTDERHVNHPATVKKTSLL